MTALLYFLIATFIAFGATRAWLMNRESGAHIAFLAMGWSLCLSYACFALSLLPGLGTMWIPSMMALFAVPSFTIATFERLFPMQTQYVPCTDQKWRLLRLPFFPPLLVSTSVGTGPNRHSLPAHCSRFICHVCDGVCHLQALAGPRIRRTAG